MRLYSLPAGIVTSMFFSRGTYKYQFVLNEHRRGRYVEIYEPLQLAELSSTLRKH